jgi:flagellar hook protein FlgE
MLQSLVSGISGLRTHQSRLDVIANDVANVNTIGYKQNEVTFKEALVDTIRTPAVGTAGLQVGMGTSLSGITKNFSYGMLTNTGVASNVAIQGEGFFLVMATDPATFAATGAQFYTRAGDFVPDVKDENTVYLINSEGQALIGTDGLPINLEPAGATTLASYSISTDGEVTVVDSEGTSTVANTIRIVTFQNNNGLNAQRSSLFTWTPAASATEPAAAAANDTNVGLVQQGYLESSNTELASEFTEMIITQRGFQANSRTITTSDEILQELLTLKR